MTDGSKSNLEVANVGEQEGATAAADVAADMDAETDADAYEQEESDQDEEALGFGSGKDSKARRRLRGITGQLRLVAVIPALGFFFCSVVLAVATMIAVVNSTIEYSVGHFGIMELATEYVEFADIFLLAVVLNMLSLGIISLFITDKISLPGWLQFNDLDDLKERLVSVIGVMLGVYFLGYVFQGATGLDVLWMGLGCAIVTVSLAFFVRNVFKGHGE
jgi:uncharacterized membrane protein YqhA